MPDRTILASRWKTAVFLCMCLALVLVGALILLVVHTSVGAVLGAILLELFGLPLLVVAAIQLVRPGRLYLTPNDLTYQVPPFRAYRLNWADIDEFFVWTMHYVHSFPYPRTKFVAYRFVEGRRPPTPADPDVKLAGGDGILSERWSMEPAELAALLNEYRLAAKATSGATV